MLGKLIIVAVIGYLLGNVNGAILVSKLTYRDDVRQHGSGNAGLTNFFRIYGGVSTVLVLAIDAVKTFAACAVAFYLLQGTPAVDFGKMLAGFCVVIGHMFPVFFHFHGGKGVLCCAALALMMSAPLFGVLAVVFIACLLISRYVSLTSCVTAVVYPFVFAYFFWRNWGVIALAVLLGGTVIYMHRANIKRLCQGTESKFSFHKNHNKEDIV